MRKHELFFPFPQLSRGKAGLSFLILLCAGNTWSFFFDEIRNWFNYFVGWFLQTNKAKIWNHANNVTILNQGQSAGNNSFILIETSETTRKSIKSNILEMSNSSENIKLISNHVPTHTKPLSVLRRRFWSLFSRINRGWWLFFKIYSIYSI